MNATLPTALPNQVTRLLIANRGEIARRVIRTAQAMGIQTVAVFSDADRHALHLQEADSAFALGGTHSVDTYLRMDKLLQAARMGHADAVHPGYGFLSENAEFAQAVIDAGLTWVGPPPAAIRALGSKSAAKALAQQHGVPCLPGYWGADQSDATFAAHAQQLGLPLMVKAVAGGGGRGMRLVTDMAQLLPALHSARSEALAGFGNGDLLLERALLRPRHIEVQIMADQHGHCIHLGERDCSVQRRHQKIIEESPSPAVWPALREQLGQAAVALAQSAAYVGAGTVEFLLDETQNDKPFYLMEMNTRLQVEHPVTELLTGLDLVAWQLRIARGEPLPLTQAEVQLQGHAMEVRLCAEDAHFRPQTGTLTAFIPPRTDLGLRFDHALHSGAVVTPHYDSMLGKLIAHGQNREQALHRLSTGLMQTTLLGLPTNRAFLGACLAHPVFRAGQALIPFLNEQADALRQTLMPSEAAQQVAALAVLFSQQGATQVLPAPFARPVRMGIGLEKNEPHEGAALNLSVQELGLGQVQLQVGGVTQQAQIDRHGQGMVLQLNGGLWHVQAQACTNPNGEPLWHVQGHGAEHFELWLTDMGHSPPRSSNSAQADTWLRAPFNGKLIKLHVQAGTRVRQGDAVLVIESMKLEHRLCAPRNTVVQSVSVAEGQQVGPGQVLVQWGEAE